MKKFQSACRETGALPEGEQGNGESHPCYIWMGKRWFSGSTKPDPPRPNLRGCPGGGKVSLWWGCSPHLLQPSQETITCPSSSFLFPGRSILQIPPSALEAGLKHSTVSWQTISQGVPSCPPWHKSRVYVWYPFSFHFSVVWNKPCWGTDGIEYLIFTKLTLRKWTLGFKKK